QCRAVDRGLRHRPAEDLRGKRPSRRIGHRHRLWHVGRIRAHVLVRAVRLQPERWLGDRPLRRQRARRSPRRHHRRVEQDRERDQIMRAAPATKVVVLTGNGGRESVIRSVQLGAFDYHQKPIQLPDLKVMLQRAANLQTLEAEAEKRGNETLIRFADMLGHTPAMREIFAVVSRIARSDVTVLIQGESGTGKELLARAVHANSARSTRPFVAINCGAIPDTLLESELFGHERGAYTGAYTQRKGKLELADGGTLFLDEIGEMSPPLQVKLLRFLQERGLERVGGRGVLRV